MDHLSTQKNVMKFFITCRFSKNVQNSVDIVKHRPCIKNIKHCKLRRVHDNRTEGQVMTWKTSEYSATETSLMI